MCPGPRTHQDRQGRSKRAASSPGGTRSSGRPGWQIAPQPKLAALPHTAQASWNPRRLRIPMIVPGWVGWRRETQLGSPADGGPTPTSWGIQRWDLGLSTSPYQINQPTTCDHTCTLVDTVYMHPHGSAAHTHTHTHEHTGTHGTHRYTPAHTCSHINRHPCTCAHGYCTLTCKSMQTKTPMCTPQAHNPPYKHTQAHTQITHTLLPAPSLTQAPVCAAQMPPWERRDRGQQC